MDNRPIGVFDSGLGGLTGVRELRKRLPHEDIIYFGDTGRCPAQPQPETILCTPGRWAFLAFQKTLAHCGACGMRAAPTRLRAWQPPGRSVPTLA